MCTFPPVNFYLLDRLVWKKFNNYRATIYCQCIVCFFNAGQLTKEEQFHYRREAQTQTTVGIVKKEMWQFPYYRQAKTRGQTGRLMVTDTAVQFSSRVKQKAGKHKPVPPERPSLPTRNPQHFCTYKTVCTSKRFLPVYQAMMCVRFGESECWFLTLLCFISSFTLFCWQNLVCIHVVY